MNELGMTFSDGSIELDDDRWSQFIKDLDQRRAGQLKHMVEHAEGFRSRISSYFGAGFELMDLVHLQGHESCEWARSITERWLASELDGAQSAGAWADYWHVLHSLASQSVLVFGEVIWLLRGGFPRGATARVRTMQELWATSKLLHANARPDGDDPAMLRRYIDHEGVYFVRAHRRLVAAGLVEDEGGREEKRLNDVRNELRQRYGSAFTRNWGWALQHLPDNASTADVLTHLGRPGDAHAYGEASIFVHAGESASWRHALDWRQHESVLLAGAKNNELALPAVQACIHLLDTVSLVVPTSIVLQGSVDDTGALFLAAVMKEVDRACRLMVEGERRVGKAEEEFQEQLRLRNAVRTMENHEDDCPTNAAD